MKLTVNVNMDGAAQAVDGACKKASHAVAVQVAKDTEPFVPARTLSLSNRTLVEGSKVIYPGPYARYLYYGKLMVDPETGSSFAPKGGTKVLTDKDLVFSKSVHGQAQARWFEVSKAQNIDKWVRVAEKAAKKYV